MSASDSGSIWCHACNIYSPTYPGIDILECPDCSSPFIEIGGQNVENFISDPSNEALPLPVPLPPSTSYRTLRVQPPPPPGWTANNRQRSGPQPRNNRSTGDQTNIPYMNRIRDNSSVTRDSVIGGFGSGLRDSMTDIRRLNNSYTSQLTRNNIGAGNLGNWLQTTRTSWRDRAAIGFLETANNNTNNDDMFFENRSENAIFENILHHILMNESSYQGIPPASETVIANLPTITLSSDDSMITSG